MPKKTTNRYEAASCNTEKMFADALKRLLKKLPLEKISVQKLADECGVNRKTFYYHFESMDDLLGWMLETDAIEAFRDVELCNDPEELLRFYIRYTDQNRKMIKTMFRENSLGFGQLKIYGGCHRIVRLIVEQAEREQQCRPTESYRDYLIDFYTGALTRSFSQYIYHQQPEDQETVIAYLLTLLKTGLAAALTAEPKEKVIPK